MSGGFIGQRGPTAHEETQKEDIMKRLRYPSPSLVVAALALFVSTSGTAVAAGVVPMAKKALFANNAGKLQGKTLGQVAALPGPANKAASLVSVTSTPFSLGVSEERDFTIQCASGAKAISGGYTSPNSVLALDSRPSPDGAGWAMYLVNLSNSAAGAGAVHAVCLR
jgi:hypothetical protein